VIPRTTPPLLRIMLPAALAILEKVRMWRTLDQSESGRLGNRIARTYGIGTSEGRAYSFTSESLPGRT